MDSDLALSRSEARGHPVVVVRIGDAHATVLDYDDASTPFPSDTEPDEWSRVDREGLWRVREAGRVPVERDAA